MKKKGSISDFTGIRNGELYRSFSTQLRNPMVENNGELYLNTVKSPCSRFWVSERRAAEVVSALRKGSNLPAMLEEKRRMYEEIYKRTEDILVKNPELSLSRAVEQAVWSPAPEFYLSPETARKTIRHILRNLKERRGK
ncbi:MAG: hypothetical protein HDS82_03120 [Bacteroidales bacterium]|nr:hypothetical protein [Bacteroidales bacterium]